MRGVPSAAAAQPARKTRSALVRNVPLVIAVGTVGVAAVAVLAGGGSSSGALASIGVPAVVLAAAGLAAGALRLLPPPAPGVAGLVLLGLLCAHAVWSGVTISWSIAPDRSWDSVNRTLVYLALLALGMVAGALVRAAPRLAAAALAGLLGSAVFWSLAGKVVPALGPGVERSARLVGPLDYWNALALAAAMSFPLWLWAATEREHGPLVRAAAAGVAAWATSALLLTGSRGGLLVAGLAVAVWLALAPSRLESAAALALALPVGGAVGVWALTRPGIAEVGAAMTDRTRDGALLGLLLVLGAAVVAAAALALLRTEEEAPFPPPDRRRLGRFALGGGAALVAVVALVLLIRAGGPGEIAEGFRNPPQEEVQNDPSRYLEVGSNHRWTWWTEAWEIFEGNRLGGTGAGSFEVARLPIRGDTRAPMDPHNLALKALSETGVVGLLLVLGIVAAGAVIVVSALQRLRGAERAAAAALVAGAAAWFVHALIDMTWELAAVTAPVALSLGVLSVSGRRGREHGPRRLLGAVAAVTLGVALLFSLLSPRLAERRLDSALDALVLGRPGAAIELARDAQELNPLAVEPIHLEAAAYEALGRLDAAETLYVRAAELQPQNPVTWYELGRFRYEARGDLHGALTYLDRSWGIDPWAVETGRLLDAVRAEMERAATDPG